MAQTNLSLILATMFSISTIVAVIGWIMFPRRAWANEDLDIAMNNILVQFKIRGGSIAYYDKAKMTEPILRGYGRTASADSSPLVTADTVFMIASLSKVFAGAAVLALIDNDLIDSLDDDICDVLPSSWDESACRNPKYPTTPVTWRMLVTHRSSLRENIPWIETRDGDYYEAGYGPIGGYFGEAAGGECPLDDVVGFYRDFCINKPTETLVGSSTNVNWYQLGQQNGGTWQNFEPGSRESYSNFAIGYIAALVELASGQSFPSFCKEYIFDPLQMTSTAWFRQDLPSSTQDAMPVEHIRRNRYEDVGHYCFIDYASGSLRTSIRDMARFLDAMMSYGSEVLWPRETGVESLTCQERDVNGNLVPNCAFGVNWILLSNSGKSSAGFWMNPFKQHDWTNGGFHDGAEAGAQTHMMILPESGIYAAVLTNTDGNDEYAAQEMLAEMAEALKSLPTLPPPTPAPTTKPTTPPPSPTAPVQPPTPSPTDAPNVEIEVQVVVQHDDWPEETSWSLEDVNGNVLLSQGVDTVFQWSALIAKSLRLAPGEYTFQISDTEGDGICCYYGHGFFEILVDGEVVLSGSSFTSEFSSAFLVGV